MSDAPAPPPTADDIVMLGNEYNAVQRRLLARKQQLEALLGPNAPGGEFPTDFAGQKNRRYGIDFTFTPGELVPQELSVTIEQNTIFRCAAMESFVRAVGTAEDPFTAAEVAVQPTLPWNDRLIYFDYLWSVRDTGTDRQWTERPQPSLFGGGGYWGPLWFPRRNILGGGTTIFVQIDPFLSLINPQSDGSFFEGGDINSYLVHISFIGHQVPDDSEL